MILTIDINKIVPGIYEARPAVHGVQAREPENYDRIDTAIRQEALDAMGFANFLEFTYGGMSTGTLPTADVPARAEELANKLVALNAQMREIDEQRHSS